MHHYIQKITPRVARRNLLLVACGVWLTAGGMLLWRSLAYFSPTPCWPAKNLAAIAGGVLFFRAMFLRISSKHIKRIENMQHERPCFFSFFNLRSYGIMGVMITAGVAVRTAHVVGNEYLSLFYIFMSIPLLISSVRFFRAWYK
jgi:hypothetical protein